jgi:hypothetical protein
MLSVRRKSSKLSHSLRATYNPEGKLLAAVIPNEYCMASTRTRSNKADKTQDPNKKD